MYSEVLYKLLIQGGCYLDEGVAARLFHAFRPQIFVTSRT